jgi:hypothetical protein
MIKNALIESTMLGWEDHGILTAWLTFTYDGAGQGFGGYSLDEPIKKDGKFLYRRGTDYGMQFIEGIMKAVGATSWEKLKGMHCRVETDSQSDWGGKIIRIGHIIKEQWFSPEELTPKGT